MATAHVPYVERMRLAGQDRNTYFSLLPKELFQELLAYSINMRWHDPWAKLTPHLTMTGHTGAITAIKLLDRGLSRCKLLSSSRDGTVREWDLQSGQCLRVGSQKGEKFPLLALDCVNSLMVIATTHNAIQHWSYDTFTLSKTYPCGPRTIIAQMIVRIAGDNLITATSRNSPCPVVMYDSSSMEVRKTFETQRWDSSEHLLAISHNDLLEVYRIDSLEVVFSYKSSRTLCVVTLSPAVLILTVRDPQKRYCTHFESFDIGTWTQLDLNVPKTTTWIDFAYNAPDLPRVYTSVIGDLYFVPLNGSIAAYNFLTHARVKYIRWQDMIRGDAVAAHDMLVYTNSTKGLVVARL